MDFVVGFAFTPDPLPFTRVLLIEKLKPAWQAGKLNGVGGKIDHYVADPTVNAYDPTALKPGMRLETPVEAMVREFHEETGVASETSDWQLFAIMHNGRFEHQVYCFESLEPRLFYEARTMEAERLVPVPVNAILHPNSYSLVPNLRAKILLGLDRESWHRPTYFVYGGEHFAGASLDMARAADPMVDPR